MGHEIPSWWLDEEPSLAWEQDTEITEEFTPGVQLLLNLIEKYVHLPIFPRDLQLQTGYYMGGFHLCYAVPEVTTEDLRYLERRGWIALGDVPVKDKQGHDWLTVTAQGVALAASETGLG